MFSLRDIVFANLSTQNEIEFWKEFEQIRRDIYLVYVDFDKEEGFCPLWAQGYSEPEKAYVVDIKTKEIFDTKRFNNYLSIQGKGFDLEFNNETRTIQILGKVN